MKKRGIIAKDPNYEEEYANFYILSKDIKIFDAKLVVYKHDYMTKWIGCCVRYGVSLILMRGESFDRSELNAFADKNACIIETMDDVPFWPDGVISALRNKGSEENYLILSCREGDKDVLPSKHQHAENIGNEKIKSESSTRDSIQEIKNRCQTQMGEYGAAMVKACVDQDLEALQALGSYLETHKDIVSRCFIQMKEYGYVMVKACAD